MIYLFILEKGLLLAANCFELGSDPICLGLEALIVCGLIDWTTEPLSV